MRESAKSEKIECFSKIERFGQKEIRVRLHKCLDPL